MTEKEPNPDTTLEKMRGFAEILASWDHRIIEIVAIKNRSSDEQTNKDGKIQLICSFNPEPLSDNSGYVSIINLMLRDDHEGVSDRLGLPSPVDFGFNLDDMIYLPNGEIIEKPDDGLLLWSQNEHEGEGTK